MRITIFCAHQPITAANTQWHTRKMALQPIDKLAALMTSSRSGSTATTGSGQGGCNGAARTSCHHLSWTMNGFGSLGVAGHALFATDADPAPAVPVAAVVAPAAGAIAVVAPAADAIAVVAPAAPAAAVVAPAACAIVVVAPATATAVVAPATAAAVVTTSAAGAAAERAGPSTNDGIGRRAGENTARTGSLQLVKCGWSRLVPGGGS